ncbi:YcaO-like family protein [Neomesorhizobium albiziae]|uniref:YcaO-like family protein n=1 Tax=Neomesorhizobium albiziae TaxID=335020 RepID=UPI00313ABE52
MCPVDEIHSLVERIIDRVPITRVADITPLDSSDVPVFAAISPLARDLTTHLGKGLDKRSARVSAIMEAVERVSAEQTSRPCRRATHEELRCAGVNVADPLCFDLSPRTTYRANSHFEWVEGWDLIAARPVWILADLARSPAQEGVLDQVDTNGLAAGATYGEAIRHALLEVVERDAVSQHQFFELYGEEGSIEPQKFRIDPNSIPESAKILVERAVQMELEVVLEDLCSDIGVPVIACTLIDYGFPSVQGPTIHMFAGWGADPVAEVAVGRAMTEAFQSRAGVIQGARDSFNSVPPTARPFTASVRRRILEAAPLGHFSVNGSLETGEIGEEVDHVLDGLRSVGIDQAIVIDMGRADLCVPVVRVRVPGLSAFVMDRRRLGWRCARHLL